ncbi:MAG: hypothetical protein ACJ8AO_05825 [Gemmatimonadaceae bacterium]
MNEDLRARLLRAWLVTAVVDGIFASTLSATAYGSTVARLWQGVASVLLGPSALQGGTRTMLIGLLMHVGVALGWSAVFLFLWARSARLRRLTSTWPGILGVAAAYGPLVWPVMSLVVIPTLRQAPPTFNVRWVIQLFGHIPAVAVPIVACIARGGVREPDWEAVPAAGVAPPLR